MSRLRTKIARDGGFGLLEILGVLLIVAILAAVAIPINGHYKEKAHVKAMESEARSLSIVIDAFTAEHGQVPNSAVGSADKSLWTIRKNAIVGPPAVAAVSETAKKNVGFTITGYQRLNTSGVYTASNAAVGYRFQITYPGKTTKTVSYNSVLGGLNKW
ncbi:type II secretion system protein [Aeromicrobium sp. 179-A 4D2 NHS]|uniref:type II secretion system protein n=1 Tax=Aeromicrobium sp. 179-A 4D2 NHS TaxID=3142375 RepID=UPI0039A1192F